MDDKTEKPIDFSENEGDVPKFDHIPASVPEKRVLAHCCPDGKIYINPNTPGLFDSVTD